MSNLRKEIEKYFAVKSGNGAYKLSGVEENNKTWVIRNGDEYGVFFEYGGEDIAESFSSVMLKTDVKLLDNTKIKVLQLTCLQEELRNEFSVICEDFADTGSHGEKREKIIDSPLLWWMKWKELLGNIQGNKMVYDIIGELSSMVKLCQIGDKPFWSAIKLNTHDIETADNVYEIKSTINKEKNEIHVSSQFQLTASKPLYLIFTRLEESLSGESIDDLLMEISKYEPDMMVAYNTYLKDKGFPPGNHYRKIKYALLERRRYCINESFPKITEEMFSGGTIPSNISHIEYNVSLDGLQFDNWK